MVRIIVPRNADRNAAKLICSPLSNKITTRATVVNISPTTPKCSGEAKWKIGPMKSPMRMR
jgi:hypothetical protein